MTLARDMKYVFTHKNHVVSCPNINCGNTVLRIENPSRVDREGETRTVYQCLLCYRKFSCCAKSTNAGAIQKTKREMVREVANLRKRISYLESKIYTDNEPMCILPQLEDNIEI